MYIISLQIALPMTSFHPVFVFWCRLGSVTFFLVALYSYSHCAIAIPFTFNVAPTRAYICVSSFNAIFCFYSNSCFYITSSCSSIYVVKSSFAFFLLLSPFPSLAFLFPLLFVIVFFHIYCFIFVLLLCCYFGFRIWTV